jgi:putative oxidoreductase
MLDALMTDSADAWILLARLLLVTLFLLTGWQKMTSFSATVAYMASLHTPLPKVATVVSIVMEFFVGIALALGIATRPLAALLALFTIGTALLGHRFWTMHGAERHANQLNFYKNMSIAGGLLLLAVTGGGRFAVG